MKGAIVMKQLKKQLKSFIFCLTGALLLVACQKDDPTMSPEPSPDPSPDPGEEEQLVESSDWLGTSAVDNPEDAIPRVAWGIFPKELTSAERFQEMKDAGITHCVDWRMLNLPQSRALLDAAAEAGIRVILPCRRNLDDPEGVVNRFQDHPALDGYYLGDEPDADIFPLYGEMSERFRAIDSEHHVYVNLPRITHPDPIFGQGTPNYIAYVHDFLDRVKPRYLSFDNYPLYYIDGQEDLTIDRSMFENLEVIRDISIEREIPFWAFTMTTHHRVGKRVHPDPTMGHLRYHVFCSLAYGAQGIEHFTYWQAKPSDEPNGMGHYFYSAPISWEGQKTPTYGRLKTINEEIVNLSHVFQGATVKWVRHTGSNIPVGTKKLGNELDNTPVTSVSASDGLLVSLIENGPDTYLVVVNRDPENPVELELTFNGAVKRVLKSGQEVDAEEGLLLQEGDAAIYTW